MPRNKEAIRHAYENTLTACARLAAFATCKPTDAVERLISNRQKMLAINDLVVFAINARRLMDATETLEQFTAVTISVATLGDQVMTDLPITRVVNILVHHKELDIWRFQSDLILWEGLSEVDIYNRHVEAGNVSFPPAVSVQSDKGGRIAFKLSTLFEIFERDVLTVIVDDCAEDSLYLDDNADG